MWRKRRTGPRLLSILCGLVVFHMACAAVQEAPQVSQPAIPFAATDLKGRSITLADYRDKNLILVFYIGHT